MLTAISPRRVFDADGTLALLDYIQRRNAVAASHRKRVEAWIVAGEAHACIVRLR